MFTELTKQNIILCSDYTVFTPFDHILISFCDLLSSHIFQDQETRKYPDFISLAFWLRKSNIHNLKKEFESLNTNDKILVPRGLVFHIPPSNVDTVFVYSWIISLLVGNANIVRLPTRTRDSFDVIMRILQEVLAREDMTQIRDANHLISYKHEDSITEEISKRADVRIIWGGDQTIQKIRKIPLKSTAKELVFADRISCCVIHSQNYLSADEAQKKQLAEAFFNDSFLYDQAACSSPIAIFWIGNETREAKKIFYNHLAMLIKEKQFEIELGAFLEKMTFLHQQILTQTVKQVYNPCNELVAIDLDNLQQLPIAHCGFGFFYQFDIASLHDLIPWITRRVQTLTYFGFEKEEFLILIHHLNGKGIDRIVPIGEALNFSHIWDGYDLMKELTRCVTFQLKVRR